ncbi:hypothetical protein AOLI_G00325370 [Acnodon oligacanthus]
MMHFHRKNGHKEASCWDLRGLPGGGIKGLMAAGTKAPYKQFLQEHDGMSQLLKLLLDWDHQFQSWRG